VTSARPVEVDAVDDDCDRPVVHEVDGHPGAEAAGLRLDAETAQLFGEGRDERLGRLGTSGGVEAGAAAAADVGEERELADDERLATGVEGPTVAIVSPSTVTEAPATRWRTTFMPPW